MAARVVSQTRAILCSFDFLQRHRINDKAFTRRRKLHFEVVLLLILQKTIKSLQLHLFEFFTTLSGTAESAVTPGAWTHARAKFRHTAFIELNQAAVLDVAYAHPEAMALWHGHRLLAIDSSTIRMPDSDALFYHFGGQEPSNQSGHCGRRVPHARLSVLFDVLNRLGLDAHVGKFSEGEVELAYTQLSHLRAGDIVLGDRGYAGYLFLARVFAIKGHFIIRCQKQSFAEVHRAFDRNEDGASVTVTLLAKTRHAEAEAAGLPTSLRVRIISVRLSTGELEVLVTTLLDESAYPTSWFEEVYHARWGIETYFQVLKGRLDLENYTGLTVEAMLQDTHAAIFLTNLESIVTREAAACLPKAGDKQRLHGLKPNKAVTFHSLKTRILDLLFSTKPVEEVLAILTKLFLANPVAVRPDRKSPRTDQRVSRSLHYQKRVRKGIF